MNSFLNIIRDIMKNMAIFKSSCLPPSEEENLLNMKFIS